MSVNDARFQGLCSSKAQPRHFEKQQAELERARHDFNEMRKNSLEAIEKEKQVLELERKRLAAQQDNTCIAVALKQRSRSSSCLA